MKLRANLTWLIVAICIVLTGSFALFINLARCYTMEWVEIEQSNGWSVYEAWCGPTKRFTGRVWLKNWLKIQKENEIPVVLKSGSNVALYSWWTTNDFLYGLSVINIGSRGHENDLTFVFRVKGSGAFEICAEIDENITFSDVLENGRVRETEWATLRAVVDDTGGDPRLGRLEMRFDHCVGGADWVSIGWRVKSWCQRSGLIEGTVPDFSGSGPDLTVEEIGFDDLSSAKTPVSPVKSPSCPHQKPHPGDWEARIGGNRSAGAGMSTRPPGDQASLAVGQRVQGPKPDLCAGLS